MILSLYTPSSLLSLFLSCLIPRVVPSWPQGYYYYVFVRRPRWGSGYACMRACVNERDGVGWGGQWWGGIRSLALSVPSHHAERRGEGGRGEERRAVNQKTGDMCWDEECM